MDAGSQTKIVPPSVVVDRTLAKFDARRKPVRIDHGDVMLRANVLYAEAKFKERGLSPKCIAAMPPEAYPSIRSDQVKALCRALVDEINLALAKVKS